MFDSLRTYWRASLPGAGAILAWMLWSWEQYFTGDTDSWLARVGFIAALFLTGWFIGLLWSDQTKQGSWLRSRLNRRKRVEPILNLRRSGHLFGGDQYGNALAGSVRRRERDIVFVMVCIRADLNKDFSDVRATYTLTISGRAIAVGEIYNGTLSRGRVESHIPISLICDRADTNVFYLSNEVDPIEDNLVQIQRGQQIEIAITVTARGIRPLTRNYSINLRNDPFGRLLVQCPDGMEWCSISY